MQKMIYYENKHIVQISDHFANTIKVNPTK
jgi:hypothetical protein